MTIGDMMNKIKNTIENLDNITVIPTQDLLDVLRDQMMVATIRMQSDKDISNCNKIIRCIEAEIIRRCDK